jgi:hypothetical protein
MYCLDEEVHLSGLGIEANLMSIINQSINQRVKIFAAALVTMAKLRCAVHGLCACAGGEGALYLATGVDVHRYNPVSGGIEATHRCPDGTYATNLTAAPVSWLFYTSGREKVLRILNAQSLEVVGE